MEDFELSVIYKGEEKTFNASLRVIGYTYRIVVNINGQDVLFEPDEERNYRAVISYEDLHSYKNIDHELLQTISEKIKEITS